MTEAIDRPTLPPLREQPADDLDSLIGDIEGWRARVEAGGRIDVATLAPRTQAVCEAVKRLTGAEARLMAAPLERFIAALDGLAELLNRQAERDRGRGPEV